MILASTRTLIGTRVISDGVTAHSVTGLSTVSASVRFRFSWAVFASGGARSGYRGPPGPSTAGAVGDLAPLGGRGVIDLVFGQWVSVAAAFVTA